MKIRLIVRKVLVISVMMILVGMIYNCNNKILWEQLGKPKIIGQLG